MTPSQSDTASTVGPRRRPRRLALPPPPPDAESRPCLSAPLLADAAGTGEHRTEGGEAYTALDTELVVEVLAGTDRHGTLSVVRAC